MYIYIYIIYNYVYSITYIICSIIYIYSITLVCDQGRKSERLEARRNIIQ